MSNFHIAMSRDEIRNFPLNNVQDLIDAWEQVEGIINLPVITDSDIEQLEIPEGRSYVGWRGTYNGIPSSGRRVQTRQGFDTVVDVRFNTARLRDVQRALEERFGHIQIVSAITMRTYHE